MSCEHCWTMAMMLGIEYGAQIKRAEDEQQPCTRNDDEGRKLRAGQFWDEATQTDTRLKHVAPTDTPEAPRETQGERIA